MCEDRQAIIKRKERRRLDEQTTVPRTGTYCNTDRRTTNSRVCNSARRVSIIMNAEEATIHADGSTNFDDPTIPPPVDTTGGEAGEEFDDAVPPTMDSNEEIMKNITPSVDPAVYFLLIVIFLATLYYFFVYRKKSSADEDVFFANLDGDKVSDRLWCCVDCS
jgi:hypothetical protein